MNRQTQKMALLAGANNIGDVDVASHPMIGAVRKLSAQVAVAVAGTAVNGPNLTTLTGVIVNFPQVNAGKVGYVGNDGLGDVTSANGFILDPGDAVFIPVANANLLWFDASAAATFSLLVV